MVKNYVCNGAKIECNLCTKPEGTLKVTSNEIKVQDKIFATDGDKEKTNLIFEGNCKKSPWQASPCIAVSKLEKWEGVADLIVQGQKVLLEDSSIMCSYGGVPIKITDHLQVNRPTELQPLVAPVINPIDEPTVYNLGWKSNKEIKKKNTTVDSPNEIIEKTVAEERIWLEAYTMGILPREEIKFQLTEEGGTINLLETISTVQNDGRVFIQLKSENSKGKNYRINAKAIYDENTTAEAKIEILPLPKVIVDFRPSKNYDGEYGFDYMRNKKVKDDKRTYKDILGTNRAKVGGKWIYKFKKYTTDTKYNSLKDDHYKTITFPWHKNTKGKEIEYIQSWLTIYPKEPQKLSLQIDTLEKNTQDLTLEYDKALFKLNTDIVPAQSKGTKRLKDHLTIECLKEFDKPKTIKVILGSTQFGQLNILPNAKVKRKKAQVVFVKVTTELTKGKPKTGNTTNKTGKPEKEMLERYLKQAYIKLDLAEEDFDLTLPDPTTKKLKYLDFNKNYTLVDKTTDPANPENILNKNNNTLGSDSLAEYMENIYNIEMPKYKDYYKIFFFGDRGGRKIYTITKNSAGKRVRKDTGEIKGLAGHARDFNSLSAIMYKGKRKATVTHELLHAMGLKHSFDDSADYGYKLKKTENIMDYSKTRKNTWLWQWKKLWTNKDLKSE
ncbi:PAAR-like protein [Tenacibaculum finnmarkense]|uniref:PAAR-like protein n=1 Tax=Tenacibaculum finnmarkense TaxID=2781243 RepID=UPI001E4619B0|nr:PAAR-like protein [Tenacibaculum finnmarkense]MCD8411113.1 DUF4280 domain-containing protein [Tenacibaculum finnmarkense genomovar ulcerans]MCD8423606.1 DUF4280 domain-containing protein [Tenacibaculum finnmarkense genomovar ulcerans]